LTSTAAPSPSRALRAVSTATAWEIHEPKSDAGRRSVPVPPGVVGTQVAPKDRQDALPEATGDGWPADEFVFDRGDGARLGLPPIRLHDLHHTSATLMLATGVHLKVAQERLGHARVAVTLDIYSNVTASMQRQAAAPLGEMLGLDGSLGACPANAQPAAGRESPRQTALPLP
jgi:integrase